MDFELTPKSDITNYGSYDPDVTSLPAPGNFIPSQIATAYKIPDSNGAGVKVGILSLGGGFLQSDLNKSMSDLGLSSPTIRQVLLNDATGTFTGNPDSPDVENTLDIFCVAGMVPAANITIYIGNVTTPQSWRDIYNRAISDGCDVITQSWSAAGVYGDFLSAPLANAAAQGISVFNSTGDSGSKNHLPTPTEGPNYPATNANVIAVGGTILTVNTSNVRTSEIAATPSGGGISANISLPAYQSGKTYQTYNSATHITGPATPLIRRGIPDISAPFQSYAFYFNGAVLSGIGGTSAATPIMAGMMARFISLNGGRRPPPNSLSKIFYSNSNSFYDITVGNNALGLPKGIPDGYLATAGWDPVTGLGSQANGVQTYQNVTSAGVKVKTNSGWTPVKNISVKTDSGWANVQHIWVKTGATTWSQTY